jgi:hypothetical protein
MYIPLAIIWTVLPVLGLLAGIGIYALVTLVR